MSQSDNNSNNSNNSNMDNEKYIKYRQMFSFLYTADIDGVGSILFCMKNFKPKEVKGKYNEFSEYVLMLCLDALNISKKSGWDKMRLYVNLNNCSMENFSLKLFKHINSLTATAFPDKLDSCYVCSTTKLFKVIWGVVNKFIDPVTREKFQLVNDLSHLFETYTV
jgi:hypothetical protein